MGTSKERGTAVTNVGGDTVASACVEAVSAVLEEHRPRLVAAALGNDWGIIENRRHRDNFLSRFDMELHDGYRSLLADSLGEFVYVSEEGDPEVVGQNPDLVVIVDPLDTSELAVRALHGYTHLLVYSRSRRMPVAAAVGDFFHEIDLYAAAARSDGDAHATMRTRAGETAPLAVTPADPSGRLLVTTYSMRPTERLLPLARQHRLLRALSGGLPQRAGNAPVEGPTGDRSRIGVDFGSVGLCHVAIGATDAFIEFAKGFALWDLLPGRFILESAGGVVYGLDGNPLPWPTEAFTDIASMRAALKTRQTFVAASSATLAGAIARLLI
jgi:myo-inositol-1(or 4)-monophosphatase